MDLKKIAVAVASAFVFAQPVTASDAGMSKLFDEIGAYGAVTGPGAYRAQGVNVVTGGSVFIRRPVKNHNVAAARLPSLKFGCGGIDLYAGSFSFISKSELVSMMKNIGSSAVAYAFKLALDSISPQINKTLTELQQTVQDLNGMNINSCEAGEAIANGVNGDWQRTSQYFAKVSGPISGMFSDHSESRAAVQGDNTKANDAIKSVTDPDMVAKIKPGNIGWRALSKLPGLDTGDKQILMSMSGTAIYSTETPTSVAPTYKEAKSIKIHDFIRGTASGKIAVYSCSDGVGADQCLELGEGEIDVKPYAEKVEEKLLAIAAKFKTNKPLTPEEIGFINITGVPVYKALAVSTAAGNVGLDTVWIAKYADLIAAEYAYQFIIQTTHQIRQAYTSANSNLVEAARSDMRRMYDNAERLRIEAREELRTAYTKVESVNRIAEEILYMERNLIGNMPANLAGNLRFAASAR